MSRISPGTPAAELAINAASVRVLLDFQHPDLAGLPLSAVASGWDNSIFRLGKKLAIRLPRRRVAASLILHEQRWLPSLVNTLPLRVPAPLRVGKPQGSYPWPWSIVPWLEGQTADLEPPGKMEGAALAAFFEALHVPAPAEAPRNPARGVPLAARAAAFCERLESLETRGEIIDGGLIDLWEAAVSEPIDVAATWIHGDPHPRNVLVNGGRITAVIDWGDMAQGDRASDLAAIWMILQDIGERERAVSTLQSVSAATWRRARAWAVFYGVMLLNAGLVDDARMVRIARMTLANVLNGP